MRTVQIGPSSASYKRGFTILVTHRFVTVLTLASVAVAPACGSDDSASTDALATPAVAPVSAATTSPPSTTEPLTPTTDLPTTDLQEATGVVTSADTSEPELAGAEGALDFNLGADPGATPAVFGFAALTEVDELVLVERVSEALGDVDADTGWVPMPEAYACTGAAAYRSLLWDDIRYVLTRRDAAPGPTHLAAWTIGKTTLSFSPPLDTEIIEPSGITTADGIGLGTPAERLEDLPWDQSLREDDQYLVLAGLGPVIFRLDASDQIAAMRYEQNDC